MIPDQNRAEMQLIDALLSDYFVNKVYSRKKVFQGFVPPNALASLSEYVYVSRISTVPIDTGYVDGVVGATLRRVRLQVDVCDLSYTNMVHRSEAISDIIRENFPSGLDDTTYGTLSVGQTVWNVASIDVLINEEEKSYGI